MMEKENHNRYRASILHDINDFAGPAVKIDKTIKGFGREECI